MAVRRCSSFVNRRSPYNQAGGQGDGTLTNSHKSIFSIYSAALRWHLLWNPASESDSVVIRLRTFVDAGASEPPSTAIVFMDSLHAGIVNLSVLDQKYVLFYCFVGRIMHACSLVLAHTLLHLHGCRDRFGAAMALRHHHGIC